MKVDPFSDGNSLWHRMDPRVKLLGTFLFALITSTGPSVGGDLFAFGWALLALLVARLRRRPVIIRLLAVNGVGLLFWCVLPFTVQGDPLGHIWGCSISRQGLLKAASISLKANAIALITIAWLCTSPLMDLIHGLARLKIHSKLVQIFFFSIRYVSVMRNEYVRMNRGLQMRCFRPGTNLHTYRTLAYLVGMLFVRSHDRSRRIYQAMLLRGFSGRFFVMDRFRMRRSDYVASAVIAICLVSEGALHWAKTMF